MPTLPNGICLPDEVQLLECASNRKFGAKIHELTRDIAKNKIDLAWFPELKLPRETRRAEWDFNWEWVGLRGEVQQQFGKNGYGWCVCTEDGNCQGAILYQVGGVSSLDESLPTVFCHKLATAPRNRGRLTSTPRYRGVGTGLIRLAALHSFRAGLGGRVTLETYDDPDTRRWYKDLGFLETPLNSEGIVDFELVPEAASRLLANLLVQS
jgi:hypothetical protein